MINLFRKNQRVLMLIIAILTIIAFVFLYNRAQLDELASVRTPTIYGRPLSPGAIDRQIKNYQLTVSLGQFDLLTKLGGAAADRETSMIEFVWNLLVLQHQSRALGIQPTDEQIANRIKGLPVFQTESQFDPIKYAAFVRDQLLPRGFTEPQLEEIMRDALRLERLTAIIESPVTVGDSEIRETARALQGISASFIRFEKSSQDAKVQVTSEEIADYYEQKKTELSTQETRAARYVIYELPSGHKLEGKKKIEEMQKLANSASLFTESLGRPGTSFQQAAETAGLQVRSTPAFSRNGSLADTSGSETQQMAAVASAIAPTVFLLGEIGNTSDVVQVGDAFYVVELSELTPVRPLTLQEATPQIETRLRSGKVDKALREFAEKQVKDINAAMAAGASFAQAANQAGLKFESLENALLKSESLTPEQRRILSSTIALRDGELSSFEVAPWGGFCIYLKARAPLDDKELEARREEIRQSLLENKKRLLFSDWLRVARDEAKITVPGKNDG